MEKKINKKINKKKLMLFVLPLLAITLVSAVTYYIVFDATFTVTPAISVEGEDTFEVPENAIGGETIVGSPITITNDAPSERVISITDDSGENVIVSYVGNLELTKKDTTTWTSTGDTIEIEYTIVGDEFEFSGVPEGYTLIYYKDEVVELGERLENPQPAIIVTNEIGNLPQEDDANMDDLANYCATPDFYNQCKGAKLWVVLTSDITDGTLAWGNWDSFYFETDLIQFNTEGNIVLSPNASLTITPTYTPSNYLDDEVTVTTTIA